MSDQPYRKKFWLSWFETGPHTYLGPWWISGNSEQFNGISYSYTHVNHCFAAVMAASVYEAKSIIMNAHTEPHRTPRDFRFCEERDDSWEPFTERFPMKESFVWPNP